MKIFVDETSDVMFRNGEHWAMTVHDIRGTPQQKGCPTTNCGLSPQSEQPCS